MFVEEGISFVLLDNQHVTGRMIHDRGRDASQQIPLDTPKTSATHDYHVCFLLEGPGKYHVRRVTLFDRTLNRCYAALFRRPNGLREIPLRVLEDDLAEIAVISR